MNTLWQDLRYGARMLWKKRGFTALAVMMLALGIGANTAIFSVVNATLLRPLPFPQPDRLALFWGSKPGTNMPQLPLSLPNFNDVRAQCQSCESLSAWTLGHSTMTQGLTQGAEPERVQYAIVTADFFATLGAQPMLGRAFRAEEDNPGQASAVLISHSLWRRRFGADPATVGKTITLDGQPREICGVLPAGFRFASFPEETEVWLPFGLDPFNDRRHARGASALGAVARLKPGVTLQQAQTELDVISRRLEQAEPFFNTNWRLQAAALHEQASGKLRRGLYVLLGAVAFLLLIACVNVANLQLARATARRREIAIRAALGSMKMRKTTWLLLIVSSAIFAITPLKFAAVIQSREFRKAVEFNPGSDLRFNTDKGSVRLTSWDQNRVEIYARIEPPEHVDADYGRRAVETARIEVVGDARSLTILKEGGRAAAVNSRSRLRRSLVVLET